MSLFACPNSSRMLLRSALQRAVSKASHSATQRFTSTRWISGCASRNRSGLLPSTTNCRNTFFGSNRTSYETRRTIFFDKTIRNYEELPRDYRDQVGLQFRGKDLSEGEVVQAFGKGISAKRANQLLRILHGRRVAGTLEDPAFAVHTSSFTKGQIAKGLEYLRKTVTVDEVMNAGLRAEDELAHLEMEKAGKEAAKKPKQASKKNKGGAETEEPPAPVYKPDPVYGHSKLDEIRAQNVAKRKAKEALEEEARKAAEARGEVNSGTLAKLDHKSGRKITNPKIAEYYKNAQSDQEAPTELKTWERVLPSATFVALVVGFLAAVTAVYEEPASKYRVFPDLSTAHATLGTVVAANVLVWAAWKAPPLWKLFNRYMIIAVGAVKPVSMFTAPFSHQSFSHMFINMLPLFFVGSALHEDIGRAKFLTLFVGCGAMGFVGSVATYAMRGMLGVTTLGASAATLGVCAAYFWEHRLDGYRFFGLPQDGVPGIIFLALMCVPQLAAFGKTVKFKIDIASHLFGLVSGVIGMELINWNREEREKKLVDIPPPPKRTARLPRPNEPVEESN
ncbi:rhomboid-like protein [Fusarium austroafricanum]|uniref:Rhomboid-like protein n=1 Tax=Fusarium austroafricanum TaxID=2364996 RepID=A0A8H4K627_9HYPO|nr:rhomboid-like protein [Fusarium austroafricanum]